MAAAGVARVTAVELVTSTRMTHALDYGYFTIAGGIGDVDELALLGEAQEEPPSAASGHHLLVLSPHQNNFAMHVVVERWSGRLAIWDRGALDTPIERLLTHPAETDPAETVRSTVSGSRQSGRRRAETQLHRLSSRRRAPFVNSPQPTIDTPLSPT